MSWTPIRKGKKYCSPACGNGCTFAAYQQALKESSALTKKLGPKWTARVWENLGWHWRVECGSFAVRVYEGLKPQYHAEFYDRATGKQWLHLGKTPEAAIASVKKLMRDYMRLIEKAVKKAEAA